MNIELDIREPKAVNISYVNNNNDKTGLFKDDDGTPFICREGKPTVVYKPSCTEFKQAIMITDTDISDISVENNSAVLYVDKNLNCLCVYDSNGKRPLNSQQIIEDKYYECDNNVVVGDIVIQRNVITRYYPFNLTALIEPIIKDEVEITNEFIKFEKNKIDINLEGPIMFKKVQTDYYFCCIGNNIFTFTANNYSINIDDIIKLRCVKKCLYILDTIDFICLITVTYDDNILIYLYDISEIRLELINKLKIKIEDKICYASIQKDKLVIQTYYEIIIIRISESYIMSVSNIYNIGTTLFMKINDSYDSKILGIVEKIIYKDNKPYAKINSNNYSINDFPLGNVYLTNPGLVIDKAVSKEGTHFLGVMTNNGLTII